MNGRLVLVTAPTVEPVGPIEAKAWARITTTEDDALVESLITAARTHLEEIADRALLTQTWDYFLDTFPYGWPAELAVPRPNLQSVTYVKYMDTNGVVQTLATSEYTVDTSQIPARLVPAYGKVWPTIRCVPNAVQVRFVAGYGDEPEDVPQPLRTAICEHVATMYNQRESLSDVAMIEVPSAYWQLVNPYRVWWL